MRPRPLGSLFLERIRFMSQLLRQGIESMPRPLPVWIKGTVCYLRHPRVRARRRTHRRILGRLDSPERVSQGPFRGMRYVGLAYCSEILPKLVGTYESELAPAIETICRSACDRIVYIGAAEGYYAVGMALRNPSAAVVAFEINPSARFYLRRLGVRNGVRDQIAIRGECSIDSLGESLTGARRPAVICDCEGRRTGCSVPTGSSRCASDRGRDPRWAGDRRRCPGGHHAPPSGTLRGHARHRGHRQLRGAASNCPAMRRLDRCRGRRGDGRGPPMSPVAFPLAQGRLSPTECDRRRGVWRAGTSTGTGRQDGA